MSTVSKLYKDRSQWIPGGYPLVKMIVTEQRKGKKVPVIKKALVELDSFLFKTYEAQRDSWAEKDYFCAVGPIQFDLPQMDKAPYLCYKKSIDIFLSNDIPRKVYEMNKLPYAKISNENMSRLGYYRAKQVVKLPNLVENMKFDITIGSKIAFASSETEYTVSENLSRVYNNQFKDKMIEFVEEKSRPYSQKLQLKKEQKIGVLFCGRQSPGGLNIIAGLHEFCKKTYSTLYGFRNGNKGLFEGNYLEIDDQIIELYLNQGGYHLLGRNSDAIREKDFEKVLKVCKEMDLDGLVMIGATHTLTDAMYLSDFLLEKNSKTKVIAVPCTVDANVCHQMIEANVGFDTSSKVYSQLMGNILIDCASAFKYWYFIRIMGRDPSHLALECALRCQPNLVLISEEIVEQGKTLENVVKDIADVVCARADKGRNFGTILIPDGLLVSLPKIKPMFEELAELVESSGENQEDRTAFVEKLRHDYEFRKEKMSAWTFAIFNSMPDFVQKEMLMDRDHHGYVMVENVETEKLLAYLVGEELKKRKKEKKYNGSFASVTHYFGYQGRSALPTIFDCQLGAVYGFTAGSLIASGVTGYCTTARGLVNPVEEWYLGAIPLISMTNVSHKSAYGNNKAIVKSANVDLNGESFKILKQSRKDWIQQDIYRSPGPIQFEGEMKMHPFMGLRIRDQAYMENLKNVEVLAEQIKSLCRFGTHQDILKVVCGSLENLEQVVNVMKDNFR